MSILSLPVVKEIAGEIAAGNACYVHKKSEKITVIDKSTEDVKTIAAQEQQQSEVEKEIEDYFVIEKMPTKTRLSIMRTFLAEVDDKSERKQLSNALNRKNPVRNFTQVIESNMGLNLHWSNFNKKECQHWVYEVIEGSQMVRFIKN